MATSITSKKHKNVISWQVYVIKRVLSFTRIINSSVLDVDTNYITTKIYLGIVKKLNKYAYILPRLLIKTEVKCVYFYIKNTKKYVPA